MSRCHIASARSFALALSLACSVGASLVAAQDFRTGAVQSPLRVIPNSNCTELTLWSHPDLFVDDNGTLRLLANGARPQPANCAAPWDRSWSATRSSPTAPWITPGPANNQSGCPSLIGGYTRCGYSPANPGPIGAASVARAGKRHYMALQGGNADFIVGHIYWAASDDGITWDFHDLNPPPGETWTPLLAPRYHQCENGAPPPPRDFYEIPGGLTEPYLVFDANDHSMGSNGTFYLWVGSYDLRPGTLPPHWMIDSWVIRFGFDPTHPFGLGAAKQIWHRTTATNGTWKPFNSGSMVWNFDAGPPVPGEPVLAAHLGEDPAGAFAGGGGGALQWDPVANNWLHVYTFSGVTKSQRATSLAANLWSAPVEVDMTTTVALVPTGIDPILRKPYEPGIHHGLAGNRTGWWIYTPINHLGCSVSYLGLGIAPAELCTTAAPQLGLVSPGSGPTGGGTAVSISGTGLDCASSVTLGGTPAAITSRAAGLVQVTAPAHAAGAVNVVVTTPAGSATKTAGFTYVAPPAFAGYHDGIDCNVTWGWGWIVGQATTRINVDLYDGTTLLGTAAANLFRQDLENAGIGDGIHGFSFPLPSSVRDGALHTITAKFGGTTTNLGTTPRTIQCAPVNVSIVATDPTASESSGNPGQFTLTRTGNTSSPLTVSLARSGTATNGADYGSISTTQTFAAGQSTKPVALSPIEDAVVEAPETVILTVAAGSGYTVGSPASATVTILNNDFVACVPSATRLCLFGGRFEATLTATAGGNGYVGQAVSSGPAPGYFWLFSPQLPEVRVKIVDAGGGNLAVTYGASTDASTILTVKDLANSLTRTYSKAAGSFCGATDSQAFVNSWPVDLASESISDLQVREAFTCAANPTTACVLNGRFQVRVKIGSTYQQAIGATGQSAMHWFTSATQADVFVNLIDATGPGGNGKYWVYFGSLSSQPYTIEVVDSVTGAAKSYSRTAAQAYCGGGDPTAF